MKIKRTSEKCREWVNLKDNIFSIVLLLLSEFLNALNSPVDLITAIVVFIYNVHCLRCAHFFLNPECPSQHTKKRRIDASGQLQWTFTSSPYILFNLLFFIAHRKPFDSIDTGRSKCLSHCNCPDKIESKMFQFSVNFQCEFFHCNSLCVLDIHCSFVHVRSCICVLPLWTKYLIVGARKLSTWM